MKARATGSVTRRRFVQGTAAGATLTARTYARVLGANERVGMAFIGFGLIGKRHVLDFQAQPDVACVAIAEAHAGRLEEAAELIGAPVRKERDFRRVLDAKDVDAVVISTPDHWHALMTILACAAGKDVYVEKPTSLFVREGRWMVNAARKFERVVQVGTQQRSGHHYQRARELVQADYLGPITSVRMGAYRNIMPGFGRPPDGAPPPELDWDLWLGPAPARAYNPNRAIYHFRWFWDYSGGQMTNLAQHSLDIVHWFLSEPAPLSVSSVGGRFSLQDNGETPDTQDTLIEYPHFTAIWSHREAGRGGSAPPGLEILGPKGGMAITRKGFVVTPDPRVPPETYVPHFAGAHPVGGPTAPPRTEGAPATWTQAIRDDSGDDRDQFRRHARDFLDAVKARREPVSGIESGHRVATVCHLANLSLRLDRRLRWDAERETVRDDPEAAAMLERPYRPPWDRALHALGVV